MKANKIVIFCILAVLLVLFVPIPKGSYDDGGTREYESLTYKIVRWNRFIGEDSIYSKTRVYFFPEKNKSIDELWEKERGNIKYTLRASIIELNGDYILVEPLADAWELRSADRISFSAPEDIGAKVGDTVEIVYNGVVMETYPAQINAESWKISE